MKFAPKGRDKTKYECKVKIGCEPYTPEDDGWVPINGENISEVRKFAHVLLDDVLDMAVKENIIKKPD